jgi:hypothetical protein
LEAQLDGADFFPFLDPRGIKLALIHTGKDRSNENESARPLMPHEIDHKRKSKEIHGHH